MKKLAAGGIVERGDALVGVGADRGCEWYLSFKPGGFAALRSEMIARQANSLFFHPDPKTGRLGSYRD